mmetsp:Transcript_3539/g.5626  ORF Transcript_3539/g.5626 Transcript_3539/m.5626 type:complete len:139 (-) Transcript_3539:158-574(-)
MFVIDTFGGTDTKEECQEIISDHQIKLEDGTKGEFCYVYEQTRYTPETREMDIAVSFDFVDGSSLQHAFTYSWRIWPFDKVKELLMNAGFSEIRVYKDVTDDSGQYRHAEDPTDHADWTKMCQRENYVSAYILAVKSL